MGRSPENAYSFLSHPRPSDENFRYSGDRAGFMAGSFGDRARLPMEAAWTPEAATASRPGAAGASTLIAIEIP